MTTASSNHAEAMSRCIDACQRAHHYCLEAAQRLLETQPNVSGSKLLEVLTHCVGVTRLTAEMLLTDSGSHEIACELCAKNCKECAYVCKGAPELEACMKSCLECAQCCDSAGGKVAA